MSNVMLAVLSQSKAWTVLDQVDAKNLDFQKLVAVPPLLMELGLQPDIVDIWPKKLLEKATELAHKHGGEASTIMKHFIGECLESKFASIDEVFTDKLLAMLPNALQRKECWGNSFEPRVSTRRSSLLVR